MSELVNELQESSKFLLKQLHYYNIVSKEDFEENEDINIAIFEKVPDLYQELQKYPFSLYIENNLDILYLEFDIQQFIADYFENQKKKNTKSNNDFLADWLKDHHNENHHYWYPYPYSFCWSNTNPSPQITWTYDNSYTSSNFGK